MATLETVEEALALLRDNKPAEWDRFRGMTSDEYERIVQNWTRTLAPVPDDLLMAAAIIASRDSEKFLPPPGTLYQCALDLIDQGHPGAEDEWPQVVRLAKGNLAELSERGQRALARIGGPEGWSEDDFRFRRIEFLKAWESERQTWRQRAALPGTELKLLTG